MQSSGITKNPSSNNLQSRLDTDLKTIKNLLTTLLIAGVSATTTKAFAADTLGNYLCRGHESGFYTRPYPENYIPLSTRQVVFVLNAGSGGEIVASGDLEGTMSVEDEKMIRYSVIDKHFVFQTEWYTLTFEDNILSRLSQISTDSIEWLRAECEQVSL